MATKMQCEGWIGDTKSDYCREANKQATQTYGRRDVSDEVQYGWSCSYCGKFFITQRFGR